jgi:hypothetical protein
MRGHRGSPAPTPLTQDAERLIAKLEERTDVSIAELAELTRK